MLPLTKTYLRSPEWCRAYDFVLAMSTEKEHVMNGIKISELTIDTIAATYRLFIQESALPQP
jgi:hypothetical protein